jgi:hypothetical protein
VEILLDSYNKQECRDMIMISSSINTGRKPNDDKENEVYYDVPMIALFVVFPLA